MNREVAATPLINSKNQRRASNPVRGLLSDTDTKRALDVAQMVLRDVIVSRREKHLLANAFKQLYFERVDARDCCQSAGPTEELKE